MTQKKARLEWIDAEHSYGIVSRVLHWFMAYLIIWQFLSISAWRLFGPQEWVKTVTSFGPSHGIVGLLVILFVLLRAIWALINRKRRPPYAASLSGRLARYGHVVLYLLMFVIPALALLRAYGSGKGWKPWDIPLIPATGQNVEWMVMPANLFHGRLSWLLCALIAGHVVMALYHGLVRKDDTLRRMAGRLPKT